MGQQSSKGRTAPARSDLVRESKIAFGSLKRGIFMQTPEKYIYFGNIIYNFAY